MKRLCIPLGLLLLTACVMPEGNDVAMNSIVEPSPSPNPSPSTRPPHTDLIASLPQETILLGSADSSHTAVLITETHCDYCKDFHEDILPVLLEANIAVHTVPLVLNKYPNSRNNALQILCAEKQNQGVAMLSSLFGQETELALDTEKLAACISSERAALELTKQQEWIAALDVTLVPTLFLFRQQITGLPYEADIRGAIREHTQ